MTPRSLSLFILVATLAACQRPSTSPAKSGDHLLHPQNWHIDSSAPRALPLKLGAGEEVSFQLNVPQPGRYQVVSKGQGAAESRLWLEDYTENQEGRTYDVSGYLYPTDKDSVYRDGLPLDSGRHPMQLHVEKGAYQLEDLYFKLQRRHQNTPKVLTQETNGKDWQVVWQDEFEGAGLPDTSRWQFNFGNWGWGNRELQYYTQADTQNAYLQDGALHIIAQKPDAGRFWRSARLTTQGRVAFRYGKITFRAKVPTFRGTWSAGWTLGDAYRDEESWPDVGEIDILECVGYEINDSTGRGLNHATCHTPAYYFKKGNQISAVDTLEKMNSQWHTYSAFWYPDSMVMAVYCWRYFCYYKTANRREWPFHDPQSIILTSPSGAAGEVPKGSILPLPAPNLKLTMFGYTRKNKTHALLAPFPSADFAQRSLPGKSPVQARYRPSIYGIRNLRPGP